LRKKGHTLDFAVFTVVVTDCSSSFLSHLYRIPKLRKDTQILKQENQLTKRKNTFKKWETFFFGLVLAKGSVVLMTVEGLHLQLRKMWKP